MAEGYLYDQSQGPAATASSSLEGVPTGSQAKAPWRGVDRPVVTKQGKN